MAGRNSLKVPPEKAANAMLGCVLNGDIDTITRNVLRYTLLTIDIPKANMGQLRFIQSLLELLERRAAAENRHVEDDAQFQEFLKAMGKPTAREQVGVVAKPGLGLVNTETNADG